MVPERFAFWELYADSFGWSRWFVYGLAVVAMAVFGYGVYSRIKLWKAGKPEANRLDNIFQRIKGLLQYGFIQVRILKEAFPGVFHSFIFFGFVALFIGTSLTFLDEDFYKIITGQKFIKGTFYVVFSFILDIAGVLAILGIALGAFRRYASRTERLDNKQEDWTFLLLITLILITGFLSEALRIAFGQMVPFEKYSSPVGYLIAGIFSGLDSKGIMTFHAVFWFSHMLMALGFVAYLPYSKGLHILAGWFNVYTRNLGPKGRIPAIPKMMERMEAGEDVEMGYKTTADLTWKDRLMVDACTRCGRCQDVCPAHATGKELNPKMIIQDLKNVMLRGYDKGKDNGAPLLKVEEGAILSEVLWSCTNCMACMEACPVLIEHIPLIDQMRRELAMEFDDMSTECRTFFKNMDVNANPWGMSPAERADWTQGLDVPTVFDNPDFEYLFFVGCMAAYDVRSQSIAKSMVKIFNAAKINYAILGEMELCCGDPMRRLGNEASFQALVGMVKETLREAEITPKKVITLCPHCNNTLAHDYKDFGIDWEVVHHSVFIADLIKGGKITLKSDSPINAVLHDSCLLGRYNDIYDEPREAARAAGANLIEVEKNRNNGFCCGGGGGRLWLEEEVGSVEDKINLTRATQLAMTGAKTYLSACPYCMTMFDEGIKLKKVRENDPIWNIYNVDPKDHQDAKEVDLFDLVELIDIAELVARQLDEK